MYVDPGDLNKKIQIVRLIETEESDDEGHPIKVNQVVRDCWARVTSVSGTELIKSGQELENAKKRFLVRYTPDIITTDMFVLYKGDYHGIVYVNPYGDNKDYMEIWTDIKIAR